MRSRLLALLMVGLMLLVLSPPPTVAAGSGEVLLGMDQGSAATLRDAGATPQLTSYWVGPWMAQHGWAGLDNALRGSVEMGTTPVIYWYYWGDSITPACVENGCDGRTKQQWVDMTATLVQKLRDFMGGRDVIVVLENEFNKGGITDTWYAPTFDGYLEARTNELKAVPGVRVALGYGSWGEDQWGRFPRAIAASDMIGFQLMRASTRDSESTYRGAPDKIAQVLAHIQTLGTGKRALLYDVALSSYPEPAWRPVQTETLDSILGRRAEYAAAGLDGLVYRELRDNPSMGTWNYFGVAEQYWGFWEQGGAHKPSWDVWLRAASAAPVDPPAATVNVPGAFEAEAMVSSTGGRAAQSDASGGAVWNLWADGDVSQTLVSEAGGAYVVTVTARGSPADGVWPRMELRLDGVSVGAFDVATSALRDHTAEVVLPAGSSKLSVAFTNDGLTATEDRNLFVDITRVVAKAPNAAPVARFSASAQDLTAHVDASASTDADGDALTFAWDFGDGAGATGATATHAYAAAGTYTVTLRVSDGQSETRTSQSLTVTRPNGAPAASFGVTGGDLAWAFDASGSRDPDGDALTFAWDFGDGAKAAGTTASHAYAAAGTYTVTVTASDGKASGMATRTVTATVPNRAPAASFTVTGADLSYTFDASGSSDADGDRLTYAWQFGDGTTAEGAIVTRTYATPGDYTVTLRVLDGRDGAGDATRVVRATSPPPPAELVAYRAKQAEEFTRHDNGAAFADATASNGSAWLLWTNGAIEQAFKPGAGTFRIEMVAKGDYADAWPVMELRADGQHIARFTVAASEWTTYTAEVPFAEGQTRKLSIHFVNDVLTTTGDRNLRLDVVRAWPPGMKFEGESFETKGVGGVYADPMASGGKAWLLWSNGGIGQTVPGEEGMWTVEVVARGDYAKGWPVMELRLDGTPVARWSVTSTTWQSYRAEISLPADRATQLSIHFLNDYYDAKRNLDRNLYVDRVELTPTLP